MLLNTGTRWFWPESPQKNDAKRGVCACVMRRLNTDLASLKIILQVNELLIPGVGWTQNS